MHPDLIVNAMAAGEFDFASVRAADVPQIQRMNPSNFQLYGWQSSSYNILNFTLGQFGVDADGNSSGLVTPRTDGHPITDLAIRQALVLAFDRETICDVMGNGLWVPATSGLNPFNAASYMDLDFPGWDYDMNRANEILDAAGYTRRDNENMRLDLQGNRMVFMYAGHDNPLNQMKMPYNIQNWAQIGLRVEMYDGDFMDWNYFLSFVTVQNATVAPFEIFQMGWSMGVNPAPHGLWGPDATFNMPRYSSPTWQAILDDILSVQAWDADFLAAAYGRWEQAFYEAYAAVPIQYSVDVIAINNRVTGVSRIRMDPLPDVPGNWASTTWGTNLVGLTNPTPYVNTN
jgi:peptide/nickel transport system substrate-binding protein